MTPTRHVVIVTGSREWTDDIKIRERLDSYPGHPILLHGGADGADVIAADEARRKGFTVVCHPYFSHLGPAGGPARNTLLVDLAVTYRRHGYTVACEAFPMPGSVGTWDCVRKAKAAGIAVEVTRSAQAPEGDGDV